ncbi:aminotransferase class I/II-fold pyridoxal phosphate-dependent enzyme [Sediminibacillus dalangtanensis]|uniref:Aminotransferase class I/II-fold pyridoxal phosphate-dependent enzyme n=1 Tax=Sediminibacillus dalangtanensis TaxID=2729421 RepID=A0ABX7VQ12_9BACI|nr:pyridoxal phosphate-dependent aminotransferase [Sediminibacillus dalangtanensis]QTM98049.1 aminotransferase class I/II-fold pyridoxal phosphate-dependent enzyme [Sediminibacillus dalangtanensis]
MKNFEQSDLLNRLPDQFFANLVAKVKGLVEEGHDVINLGQGNPDLPTPDAIVKELQAAAENPAYHKYSPFRGFSFLKQAAADFYKREYHVDLDPDSEVAVLFGAKTGLVELSQCLLNPGDLALLPDPGYPDYMSGIALANAETYLMPLLKSNAFLPDYQSINPEQWERAKLLFLNYPNNPTSAVADKSFFDETIAMANKHNVCVIHDFAYGALGFDGEKPQSFLQSEGAKEVGVEIYTLSKTYNMAGWRVAFAVGNRSVIESINLLQDHMYVSLFGGIQHAAAKALTGDQTAVSQLVQTYQNRRDRFIDRLNEIGWKVEKPKGTFFAWLPVPDGFTSESFADLLLEKAHVAVAPGNGFGENGAGYIRVGLLDKEERLEEAADRIAALGLFDK